MKHRLVDHKCFEAFFKKKLAFYSKGTQEEYEAFRWNELISFFDQIDHLGGKILFKVFESQNYPDLDSLDISFVDIQRGIARHVMIHKPTQDPDIQLYDSVVRFLKFNSEPFPKKKKKNK